MKNKKQTSGTKQELYDPFFKKFLDAPKGTVKFGGKAGKERADKKDWRPAKGTPWTDRPLKTDRPVKADDRPMKRDAEAARPAAPRAAAPRSEQRRTDRPDRPRFAANDRPRFGGGDRPRFAGGDRPRFAGNDRPRFENSRSDDRPHRTTDQEDARVMELVESTFEKKAKVKVESHREIIAEGAFNLLEQPLKRAIMEQGYTTPTPVQEQAIPPLLEGKDVLACAQTGTGKTAAFVLPILNHLTLNAKPLRPRYPQALILAPTRELAAQIDASIQAYGRHVRFPHAAVFGGVNITPQIRLLQRGIAVLTATPGRLLDLLRQDAVRLGNVDFFVLDEADRMLDMGFIPDVKEVITHLPEKRQTLFFSATFTPPITELAKRLFTEEPVEIRIEPESPTVERIKQTVMFTEPDNKMKVLTHLLADKDWSRVLIFVRMRYAANRVAQELTENGIPAEAIHGDKSQAARTRALAGFKNGKVRALVATDIASRGIDVDKITHVINFDLPDECESYVHRIGRTARAGAEGSAVSLVVPRDRYYLYTVEKFINKAIDVDTDHEWHSDNAQFIKGEGARPLPRGNFRNRRR